MHIKNSYWKWLAAVATATMITAANAGERIFDFESDPGIELQKITTFPDTHAIWSKNGSFPGTGNSGEYLSLTEAVGDTTSIVIFPDIDNGAVAKAFNLRADIRMGNGTTDNPGGGFSISYARADDPILNGASFPGPVENGTATGISVSFDTWQGDTLTDGSDDIQGIIVTVDGESVAKIPMPVRHGACDDDTSLQTGPQGSDEGEFPRGDPGTLCWASLAVDMTENGRLTVIYKGRILLDNFQTNYFLSQGSRLVLAGRTTGDNEIKHFDNIRLRTVVAENEEVYYGLNVFNNGFDLFLREVGDTSNTVSFILNLNGSFARASAFRVNDNISRVTYFHPEIFPLRPYVIRFVVVSFSSIEREITFTPPHVVVGAEHALSGDFSKRGFLMRVVQSPIAVTATTAAREAHLAGALRDADGDPLKNLADPFGSNNSVFPIQGAINFSKDGDGQGRFEEEGFGFIPGIPGLEGGTDHVTAEILTVIEIPEAGSYTFAFNSDDGFRTTAGMVGDVIEAIELKVYEGGRSARSTYYKVVFEEAGFYKLRTLWYQARRNASLEWWLSDQKGAPIALLNDDANGGLRTFRDVPEGPAGITSISPADGAIVSVNGTLIIVTVKNGSTSVDTDSILTTLNGEAIYTANSTIDGVVTFTAETHKLQDDSEYRWEMSFKVGERTRTISSMFRTTMLAGDGLVFIEAEDFDYELGKWDQTNEIGMNGAYLGGTYQDLGDGRGEGDVDAGTSYGVDYFESNNNNSQAVYRPGTGVEAGKINGPAGHFRGTFDVETNHVVGWNDAGDWYNYTRNFPEPAQDYNVFARLSSSSDLSKPPIHSELLRVTSGVGTPTQELESLGSWQSGRTAGWDSYETFPMLDAAGDPAVVNLGGEVTLRYLVHPGRVEQDYFLFVPVLANESHICPPGDTVTTSSSARSTVRYGIWSVRNNGDGTVTISFDGTLSSSETVGGMYQPIPEATSPYTTDASGSARFYIAR
ncbi:MAG: hypothetical protein M2R45_02500 [Verrucomicrobia subdivision 3 bacterium]|nr:hypothetical protein [Limisphaerales bacterium]